MNKMVMQLSAAGDSSFCGNVGPGGGGGPDFDVLWRSNSSDDVIRRHLTAILLEDPDHRLRVAHLEPLLHMRMASQQACSSGRLQALLTDPATARIFPVDFSNTRATDWRSRVVYLDLPQLLKEASAAKQQQLDSTTAAAAANMDVHGMYANGSSGVLQAGSDAQGGRLSSSSGVAAGANIPSPQHHHSVHGQGPMMLESIFGASPALGGRSSGGAGASVAQRRISGSVGGTAGGSYGAAGSAGGEPRVSLFGSSFEVPHAIASCWAGAGSSCGSGAGSMPGAPPSAAAPGVGNRENNINSSGKESLLQGAGNEAGSGGSSTASGSSSTRSVSAATRTAQAAASRLRKASGNAADFDCGMDAAGNELSAACSSGGLSGIDVCTPKSAGVGAASGDASASPVHSSCAAEEDAEYSEAQLVFGVNGGSVPTGNGIGAAGNAGVGSAAAAADAAAAAEAEYHAQAAAAAANAGMSSRDGAPMEGVDWARVAAMQRQQQQQQQQGMAGQFGRLQHPHQASLLFGLDDLSDDLPGSSAPAGLQGSQYLQQQQHAAAAAAQHAAQQHAYASSLAAARRMLLDQAGYGGGGLDPATPSTLFSPPQHRISLGSAPAGGMHDLFLQAEHAAMFGAGGAAAAAVAAAAAGAAGFGCIGAGTTAAQLAESVLLEGDAHGLGAQQLQFGMHGSSFGSSSGGAGWRTSPNALAGHFGVLQQQQQHHQQQQQHMLHRPSDAAVDVSFRSDQVKEQGAAAGARTGSSSSAPGTAAAAGAAAGKPMSFAAAAAAAPAGPEATAAAEAQKSGSGANAAASAPRLTGWASIAAKDPKPSPGTPNAAAAAAASSAGGGATASHGGAAAGMWANGRPQSAAGSSAAAAAAGKAGGGVAAAGEAGKPLGRLPPRVRAEVQGLIGQFNGVLKADDFDEGVMHQLNAKRSEEEAVAAVRHIAHYDLANIQHMAAYLNHLVKHYNHGAAAAAAAAAEGMAHGTAGFAGSAAAGGGLGGAVRAGSAGGMSGGGQLSAQGGSSLGSTIGSNRGGGGAGVPGSAAGAAGGNLGAFGGQIRLASVPVSTKSMLQKLPLKVFKQLEQLVASCAYLEWRHFDAGVVKVLAQLSKLCEGDVFEELELLAATDLSNVEYMPAYLNKRLNNKLWSRRKADGHVPSA